MTDTPAQGTTPLWSDTQVTKAAHHNSQHSSYYSSTLHALRQMRDDYETDRQRLIAELAEKQAYALQLERALGEATELDSPDGEGYWEFTGRIEGSSVDKVQWLVMVRFAKLDKQYYAYRFGGMTIRANLMIGAWKRIYTSWDRRTSSSPTAGDMKGE